MAELNGAEGVWANPENGLGDHLFRGLDGLGDAAESFDAEVGQVAGRRGP